MVELGGRSEDGKILMPNRKRIPSLAETNVLALSRRRCCLCFFLCGDSRIKKGQIAHIDGNSGNADETNLAFLCWDHHDQLDSKTSQSKNLTVEEVRRARALLYKAMGDTSGDYAKTSGSTSDAEIATLTTTQTQHIDIVLNADFATFTPDDQERVLRGIGAFLERGDITVVSKRPGSVVLTLALTPIEAERILWAAKRGELAGLAVIDARFVTERSKRARRPPIMVRVLRLRDRGGAVGRLINLNREGLALRSKTPRNLDVGQRYEIFLTREVPSIRLPTLLHGTIVSLQHEQSGSVIASLRFDQAFFMEMDNDNSLDRDELASDELPEG